MRKKSLAFLLSIIGLIAVSARADFNGSTYTLTGPYSLYVATGTVNINQVVAGAVNSGSLIISNAAANSIQVNWAAPGHAVGLGTTNQVILPGGEVLQIAVSAAFPGLVTYSTQLEYMMPPLPATSTDIVPELLYYRGFWPDQPADLPERQFHSWRDHRDGQFLLRNSLGAKRGRHAAGGRSFQRGQHGT